jgi:hypothetical protein
MVTYVLVVDDDALALFDIHAVGGLDPALPEDAVDPCEAHARPLDLVHVDADAFGVAQCALVVFVLGFFDAELLRVT